MSGGGRYAPPAAREIFEFTPQSAAVAFPRRKSFLFALICLVWLLIGISGRDPWKPEETLLTALLVDDSGAIAFANAFNHSLYLGLAATMSAATAWFLPLHEGARLVNALLLSGGMLMVGLCLWRRYGLRAAWLAALLLLGVCGLLLRGHQLTPDVFSFFAVAVMVAGMFVWDEAENRHQHALAGGALVALGVGLLVLNNDFVGALLAAAAALAFARFLKNRVVFVCIFVFLLAPPAAWKLSAMGAIPPSIAAIPDNWIAAASALNRLEDFLRVAGWSLFPILPGAVAGLWLCREPLPPAVKFCIVLSAVLAFNFLLTDKHEEGFFILLAPLTVVAAVAQKSFSDDAARILDLFALLVTGLVFCGGLWLVWFCLQSGAPAALFDYLRDNYPGYALPPTPMWKVATAAALAGGWLLLIRKFGYSKERATVNWAGSIMLVWATFNLLLVGYVDSGKSFRQPATEIAAIVHTAPPDASGSGASGSAAANPDTADCVTAPAERHWRAQLRYFGARLGGEDCRYFLIAHSAVVAGEAEAVWSGGRGGQAEYRLYRRF